MAAATGRVDEFVKDYLAFRGLSTTLKTLEFELKNEKEKGFRVDKMVEQLQQYITSYDLINLREYWNFLNSRLFCRLEQRFMSSVRKLEVGLLKLYLVNAAQKNKSEKIREFFEKMTDILQNQPEFKEWFAFPFIKSPEENHHYSMYFTTQWQETFYLSLHNFLSVILQAMPVSVLLNFETDYRCLRKLQDENEVLKQQLLAKGEKPDTDWKANKTEDSIYNEGRHMELVYDFSALGEDTVIPETAPVNKSPRKFPFSSSPLSIGKKTDNKAAPTAVAKKKDDQMKMTKLAAKDSHSRPTSNLLPIITRQKKSKQGLGLSQSVDVAPTSSGLVTDSSNVKMSENTSSVQKMKKMEGVRQERKELLEAKEKSKDEEPQQSNVTYNRSVSEPNPNLAKKKSIENRRTVSKSIIEGKTEGNGMESQGTDSVLPLTTATPSNTEQLQTFLPPQILSEESSQSCMETGLQAVDQSKAVKEKPFFLLSQDEYSEHRSAVSYARFSSSGQYIASVDVDGVVKVWSWTTQTKTAATQMCKSAFLSLEWASKSDRWLLLGNRSGNIRLFDVREMKSFYETPADPNFPRIISLCASPASHQFVCSGTTGRERTMSVGSGSGPETRKLSGNLSVWDLKTMKTERQLPIEPGPVCINSCAFNHNGHVLLTGGEDGVIRLYDIGQQRCISQWQAHNTELKTVMFSTDFTSCYSLGADGKLIEWSMYKTSEKLRELPINCAANYDSMSHGDRLNREVPTGRLLALDPDGGYMLALDQSNTTIFKMIKEDPGMVYIMDLKTQKSSMITTVDWSPNIDTKVCLTGYLDGRVIVSTLLSH